MKANFVTLVVVLAGFALFAQHAAGLSLTPSRIAGLSIAIPSLALFVLARIQVGRAFSVQAKASVLVTTGLYARIRNPIYLFGGLTIAGVILWAGKPWYLLCFVVLIPLQMIRIRKEEQVLTKKFGAAYLEYKQKTWF